MPPLLGPLSAVVALGLAPGLNLYATIAVLGLGARLGWIAPLPPELRGLSHPLIVGGALLFLVVEAVAERIPFIDSVWSTLHAVLKPAAAAILALAFVGPAAHGRPVLLGLAALAAALLAFGAHAGRGSAHATIQQGPGRGLELALSVAQIATATALVVLFRSQHRVTLIIGLAAIAWIAVFGPRSWRLLTLTLRAQLARIRRAAGQRADWREADALPDALQTLLPPRGVAESPARVLRAGLKGLPGVGAYRSGWIAVGPDYARFLFRSGLRARSTDLPAIREARAVTGPWLDTLEIQCEHGPCSIFLLKDGPRPELALADLRPRQP